MQTVIRWRRPSEIETTTRYPSSTNACSYLLRNALCYVISGTLLLVVGVIITSLTFQNLDGNPGENKERYAGPVLIAAGVLVMARGAFSRLWPFGRGEASRRRSLIRRYISEIYSRPIVALENSSTFSLCDMDMSGLYQVSSGGRLYVDEPPSYELVTSQEFNVSSSATTSSRGEQYHQHQHQHLPSMHAYSNPANNIEDDEEILMFSDGPIPIIITPVSEAGGGAETFFDHSDLCYYNIDGDDPNLEPDPDPDLHINTELPPPSYAEYIQSEEMKTTRL